MVATRTRPAVVQDPGPTDAVLVLAARGGESWACEALFHRHAVRLTGLVHRLLGRHQDVEDVVQDVFVAAFTQMASLDDPQSFVKWTTSIAVRIVCKRIRRTALLRRFGLAGKREPFDLEAFVAPTAPPDVVAELSAVYRSLDELSADERAALVLRRVEGLSLEEVADALGVSLATAKRRLSSAEDVLCKKMEGTR